MRALPLLAACLAPLAAAAAPAPAAPLPEAEPIGLSARAERASVRLGEPFGYTVEIRHRPEERYAPPAAPDLSPFRADGLRCRREEARGEARTTCTARLALFALGPAEVPALAFDVERPAGRARLLVPGPRVTGVGVLDPRAPAGALRLRDVAPPVPLLVRTLRPLWWALGILAAAAALALGLRALRRARRRPAPPPPSPAERLRRRLEALEAERLPERGQADAHVARLAAAVREYLGALSGLPALDLTSAELLAALAAAPDPRLDLPGLERLLAGADLVKFARQPAGPAQCAEGLRWARELLLRTTPPPAEAARA